MLFVIGFFIVIASVLGGYYAIGGHLLDLWQPFELVIIVGAAIGACVIANTKFTLGRLAGSFQRLIRGPRYHKKHYLELLSVLYTFFKVARAQGSLGLEAHAEKPHESPIFLKFPVFLANPDAVNFLCDYLRLMTMGTDNPHEVADLLEEEMATKESDANLVPEALRQVADGLPALGIVAAVLGVIHTMGSITEPPEVLGYLIGSALVGTLVGVLFAYGFVGPVAQGMHSIHVLDAKYFECIKVGILAHLNGYAPALSVEFARKTIYPQMRPTFYEVEDTVSSLGINT